MFHRFCISGFVSFKKVSFFVCVLFSKYELWVGDFFLASSTEHQSEKEGTSAPPISLLPVENRGPLLDQTGGLYRVQCKAKGEGLGTSVSSSFFVQGTFHRNIFNANLLPYSIRNIANDKMLIFLSVKGSK